MALNNFMHPRNIYKNRPDFSELAKMFPEFSSICKMDVSGKVTIDFKDPHCLRILTKCLLKSDFDLDIEIPENRLVPTLPLRVNYILWIEDLLNSICRTSNVWGIDIGTGACAIYPVLAATKNKWNMIGTETDSESFQKAEQNIGRNNLNDFIKLFKNPASSLVKHLLDCERAQRFDFCMCNPPFYSSFHELCESRNPSRCPPKNGFTGSPQELITEGGELEFCKRLINESKAYKERVIIFTTMIGHKHNLKELLQDLAAEGIKHTHTEFCQGRVTRWGLAWTYQSHDIYNLVPPREKLRKKAAPIAYQLSPLTSCSYDVEKCTEKIKSILDAINVENNIINKRGNSVSMHLSAFSNTWSNQRRKRRFVNRLKAQEAKKIKLDLSNSNHSEKSSQLSEENESHLCNPNNNEESKSANDVSSSEPIVQAFLKVVKKNDVILFEIEYLSGSSGKEGLHQIVQYIKNNWK